MTGPLGLYGGSFDPPHHGHVLSACYALATGQIEALWVVPTFAHPFRKPLTAFDDRMQMCTRAFADLRRCEVVDLERELGGTSYTLELIEAVRSRQPGRELRLLMGTDLLSHTDRWHRFDRICELAPPLIIQRRGHESSPSGQDVVMPKVSSTEIRARLARGEAPSGLLPRSVLEYAQQRALYGESP